jgi:transposase
MSVHGGASGGKRVNLLVRGERRDPVRHAHLANEPLLPDQAPHRGGRWAEHRMVLNGMLWRARCGVPWRDVPPSFGHWKTIANRHRRWSGDGTLAGVLEELRRDADLAEGPTATSSSTSPGSAPRGWEGS